VTPSDSTGLVWNLVSAYSGGASGLTLAVWYANNITGNAANTFTLATTGADTPTLFVAEFSGRDLNVPFDGFVTASDSVAASGAHTTGTISARGGDDLLAFNVSSSLSQAYTATGLWAIPPNGTVTTGVGYDAFVQYINSANNGANANTYSVAAADKLDAFIVALKPPALPYSDEWLDYFNEVPEVYASQSSYQQYDIFPQVAETDQDWNDEAGDSDAWWQAEDQSGPVVADNVAGSAVQYFGEDAELLDEVLNLEYSAGGYQTSDNTPPLGSFGLYEPFDWFQEIDDDEWVTRDESNVQNPTVTATVSQVEDPPWEDEDPDDFFADDFGNDDADLPQNDAWDHWPTDDDDYVVIDDYLAITNPGPLPITVEDAYDHWPTDDDEYFIVDEYALALNSLLSIEDGWQVAFDDFADQNDEFWWIENETDYRLVDNNPVINLEDPYEHWPTDDDDYSVQDDYQIIDVVPGAFLNVEDAYDHWPTDDDEYFIVDEYALVTLVVAIAQPPEDPTDWTQAEDDWAVPDDYAIIDVAPSVQVPVDDAWDWNVTDDDDYVVVDDYALVNNTPLGSEDAWDHFTTDPDDEVYQALDADPVSVPQPAAVEDPWDWTQDADDEEWAFRDADAVQPLVGLSTQTDGWDHFSTDDDEWAVPEDYQQQSAVVAPSQFTDDAWDWFYEPAEDNDQDFAVESSALPANVYVYDPNFEVYMPQRNWVAMWLPTGMGTI
jgi:hypothetical protein